MRKRPTFAVALAFMLSALAAPAARCAESDGSLDSMWNDQVQGSNKSNNAGKATGPAFSIDADTSTGSTRTPSSSSGSSDSSSDKASKPVSTFEVDTTPSLGPAPSLPQESSPSKPAPKELTGSGARGMSSTSANAPLCALDSFKHSDLVAGSWPGIGPFQGDADELTDISHNKLHLGVEQDKVTSAELSLASCPNVLLKLQMSSDYLLESLGAHASRISDFNTQFEKARKDLMSKSSGSPLNLSTGRYLVYIYPSKTGGSTESSSFVVKVSSKGSKDGAPDSFKSGSSIAAATGTSTHSRSTSPSHSAPAPGRDSGSTPRTTAKEADTTSDTGGAATTGDLREQFRTLISSWEDIKKVAVRQRDATTLAQVLAGTALAKQSKGIGWLTENHKYYEMTPHGISVDHYGELNKGQKYAVFAQVKESNKYIDETNGQVIKDTNDTYNVDYTIEKVGDQWFITDSALVSSNWQPLQSMNRVQSKASR